MLGKLLTISSVRYGKRLAVCDREVKLSYNELEMYSCHIADYLLVKGVARGSRIGLYINKSADGIAAIFGILRVGCTIVPLDVSWSVERCAYIIRDCAISYLISHSRYAAGVSEITKLAPFLKEAIFLDRSAMDITSSVHTGFPKIGVDEMAAVLYTSGSTANPKGVMRTQKAMYVDIIRTTRLYKLKKHERYALYHPLSFSPGLDDTLLILSTGAAICIMPEGISAFAVSIKEFLAKEKVTFCRFGPEVIITLATNANLKMKELPDLKKVIIAGSRLPIEYLRSIMKVLPQVKFFYEYGSTETIAVTVYPIKKTTFQQEEYIPIGRPQRGVGTYIVGEDGRKLKEKPGVTGELYVYSHSLMSGYWNDPVMTKEVLCQDPFCRRKRLVYRTKDMVTVDSSKNYVFLGRKDNVLKTKGYRIGLEEIEAALERHPKIKEAGCLATQDKDKGDCIKALVVVKEGEKLVEEEVRIFCREHLAGYMTPETIEFRQSLPRLSSGKIDKKSLK